MKIVTPIAGLLTAGCVFGMVRVPVATAVTDEEFNALKELVAKQGQRIEQLEKAHDQAQKTIQQDQRTHQKDQQELQQLKQQLEETQKTANDAQQRAASVSQVQPIHPIPEGSSATHNFLVV